MKLAEALIVRADAQKRMAQLRERLNRSAKVQEGEQPPENPADLLVEYDRVLADWLDIVRRINKTNAATPFGSDGLTLTDAIAQRDAYVWERNTLQSLVAATAQPDFRYGRAEIKTVVTFNIAEMQKRIDAVSKRHRELDTQIQALNWQIELI